MDCKVQSVWCSLVWLVVPSRGFSSFVSIFLVALWLWERFTFTTILSVFLDLVSGLYGRLIFVSGAFIFFMSLILGCLSKCCNHFKYFPKAFSWVFLEYSFTCMVWLLASGTSHFLGGAFLYGVILLMDTLNSLHWDFWWCLWSPLLVYFGPIYGQCLFLHCNACSTFVWEWFVYNLSEVVFTKVDLLAGVALVSLWFLSSRKQVLLWKTKCR